MNWTQGGLTDTQKQGLYTRAGLPVPTDLAALPTASQLAAINALGVTLTLLSYLLIGAGLIYAGLSQQL